MHFLALLACSFDDDDDDFSALRGTSRPIRTSDGLQSSWERGKAQGCRKFLSIVVRTCTCYVLLVVAVAVPVRTLGYYVVHSTGSSMTSSFYFIVGIGTIRILLTKNFQLPWLECLFIKDSVVHDFSSNFHLLEQSFGRKEELTTNYYYSYLSGIYEYLYISS